MKRIHWKTTLAGIISAIATALAGAGVLPTPWGGLAAALGAVALALLGISAADKSKTLPNGK